MMRSLLILFCLALHAANLYVTRRMALPHRSFIENSCRNITHFVLHHHGLTVLHPLYIQKLFALNLDSSFRLLSLESGNSRHFRSRNILEMGRSNHTKYMIPMSVGHQLEATHWHGNLPEVKNIPITERARLTIFCHPWSFLGGQAQDP